MTSMRTKMLQDGNADSNHHHYDATQDCYDNDTSETNHSPFSRPTPCTMTTTTTTTIQIQDEANHHYKLYHHHDEEEGNNVARSSLSSSPPSQSPSTSPMRRRKLRVLIITLGGDRQAQMEALFQHPTMQADFEPPTFSKGVASRTLRNRLLFLQTAAEAGLLPDAEWQALYAAHYRGGGGSGGGGGGDDDDEKNNTEPPPPPHDFWKCLEDIPVAPGRRGSQADVKLHYSNELWRKAKTLNRGRAVLACTLAHLIAMRTFVEGNFDVLLEDNVRTAPEHCANRLWESLQATREWERDESRSSGSEPRRCHFRFVGWLGSVPNLKWIFGTHSPKRQFIRPPAATFETSNNCTIFPFPRPEFLEEDLKEMEDDSWEEDGNDTGIEAKTSHKKPGGNPIWGSYAYWISHEAYHKLLDTLRNDVGAMLWRGKRMKVYLVKPIDKVLPRQTMLLGMDAVQISSCPAFFRAPMLTSKIHTLWDPEFCNSTKYQLSATGLEWSDLWLSQMEQRVVTNHSATGNWLTPTQLDICEST